GEAGGASPRLLTGHTGGTAVDGAASSERSLGSSGVAPTCQGSQRNPHRHQSGRDTISRSTLSPVQQLV
ncbi:unnamed protein product, partial [Rangifer tarandus platyrhynchus]